MLLSLKPSIAPRPALVGSAALAVMLCLARQESHRQRPSRMREVCVSSLQHSVSHSLYECRSETIITHAQPVEKSIASLGWWGQLVISPYRQRKRKRGRKDRFCLHLVSDHALQVPPCEIHQEQDEAIVYGGARLDYRTRVRVKAEQKSGVKRR
jgi:hypothetical protein